ncbi:MAG: glycerophosphodiester phosphodiesterase [bacterium]
MKIYAHRGSSLLWPENTLVAFEQADKHGAAAFETDLRLSKDGEIVLAHDDNLARFGQPDKTISELTAGEVCATTIPSPDGKLSGNIITLKMLLEKFPNKDYIFDCKITSELLMRTLENTLRKLVFRKRIWFLTWSQEADELVEKYFPEHPIFPREARTRTWGLLSIVGLGVASEPKNKILALPAYFRGLPVFSKNQVSSIQQRGKEFVGYLVNSRKDYDRCVRCGVQVVLTDRPDLISSFMA